MQSKYRTFLLAGAFALVLTAGLAFAIDPVGATALMHLAFHPHVVAGAMLANAVAAVDTKAVLDAIEASNKAFAEFKTINDARLKKIEEGKGGADEMKESMEKAFKDMSEAKEVILGIQAKLNRPNLGGGAAGDSEDVIAHKQAFGKFLRKGVDVDLALEAKALNIGTGSDGGFAVPKVIDDQIAALAVNISPIRALATVQQIGTSDFHKLINTRGTTSGWVGESEARGDTVTPSLVDIAPPMGELYAKPSATQQMLDDVFFNAEAWLAGEVATEFARAEGAAFVVGTGVKQPRGFCTYTNVATGDATRTFGQIEYIGTGASGAFPTASSSVNPSDTLFTTVGKMKAAYRQGAGWVLNKGTLFTIAAMKDVNGRYIFTPAVSPGVPDMILGYPVTEAEDMTAMAANSYSVAFANMKLAYLVVDRMGVRVLRDPFSNKPYIQFYTTKRVGGGVVNFEAIKLIKFI